MKIDMTLDIAGTASTADWVKQSRKKEQDDIYKAAALRQKYIEEEEEDLIKQASLYKSSDLKGLKIRHGESDFEVGQHTILTLKDSNILDEDDDGKILGVNEESDILENVNLADTDRRIERENRIKRNRQPVYSALDDAEFGAGVAPGTRAPILAQYDKEQKVEHKMELGDEGMVFASNTAEATSMTGNSYASAQSLLSDKVVASNFMTAKETVALYKRSAKSIANAKKRKIRKNDDDDDDDVNDSSQSAALPASRSVEAPEDTMDVGHNNINGDENDSTHVESNFGSRDTSKVKTAVELALEEEAQKKYNYQLAVQRARETSRGNSQFNPLTVPIGAKMTLNGGDVPAFDQEVYNEAMRKERQKKAEMERNLKRKLLASSAAADWEEDDQDLNDALAKARRIAIQNRKEEEEAAGEKDTPLIVDKAAARVLKVLAQNSIAPATVAIKSEMQDDKVDNNNQQPVDEDINTEGRRADGTLVFNSTTEFTSRLQARLNENARLKTEAAFRDLERTSSNAALSSAAATLHDNSGERSSSRSVNGKSDESHMVVAEDVEDIYNDGDLDGHHSGDSDDDDDDEEEDDQLGFLHRQPLVATGVAATLALLKGSGELRASEELAGRAKDKRMNDPSANDFNVKLEYRDDHGRKLTQKEAFRQLSYRFHGYGPGQKKKEKRLKTIESQNKASTSRLGILDGNGGMMGSFTKTQEATGRAHITIQGGASNAAVSAANLASLLKNKKQNK